MLAFTKKTGYGLIAMSYLARLHGRRYASAREIAEGHGMPVHLLMNVLKELSAAGYVSSSRGSHGGYKLARNPEDIDLQQVVSALEGPIRLAACMQHRPEADRGPCRMVDNCPLADPVHRVQRKLSDFLKAVTLAEIAEPAQAGTEE
jgi:Rrf2 family protein